MSNRRVSRALITALVLASAGPALAQSGRAAGGLPEPIAYVVRLAAPQTHVVDIEARVPTEGRDAIELTMPVWTPGSYLVREHARHVFGLT
jgi:hypothetical protein